LLIIFFGIFKITYDGKYRSNDNISRFVDAGKTVTLKGTISDLPRLSEQSVRLIVDAESITINHQTYKVSGGVSVSILRRDVDVGVLSSLTLGRFIHFTGELGTINIGRNPGEFDLRNYLHLNNIYARFYPVRLDSSCLGEEMGNIVLTRFIYPVRRSIADRLDKLIGGEEAKFLKGLIIGERSEIPIEVKTAFINSGVMHILAVSGLHVAIVTFMLIIIFQLLRIPEKPRLIATCLFLIYYMYLTGNSPSVARSVVMAIIFLCAKLFERRGDMYNILALSAIVLLLIDSKQLIQPGFQLSFVAVFAIVYLYPKLYGLKNLLSDGLKNNRLIVATFALMGVSIAAGIGTLPFTSIYFGKISVISFIANIIVVPLSNVILAIGMFSVAVSYLSTWIASIYAEVTSLLTWLMLKIVDFFGNLRFAYIDTRFSLWSSIIFYAGIGFAINIGRKEVRKIFIILTLVVLNSWLYGFQIFGPSTKYLRVTFLDIGQGDAIFLEFPNGGNMLVDAGPRTFGTDAGNRFIVPYLRYRGISRIQTILTSHPDADHLGGVPTLLHQCKVDQVCDAGSVSTSSLFKEYIHLVDSLKLERSILQSGIKIGSLDEIRLYVLHPSIEFLQVKSRTTLNNQSLVVKVVFGKTSLLLAGDAEKEAETAIESKYDSFLKSDILKISHHGSITGTSDIFLKSVRPQTAIISVGAKNKFNHPSPVVLQRIMELGCKYYRTDELGAIVLESDGERWNWIEWR